MDAQRGVVELLSIERSAARHSYRDSKRMINGHGPPLNGHILYLEKMGCSHSYNRCGEKLDGLGSWMRNWRYRDTQILGQGIVESLTVWSFRESMVQHVLQIG